MSEPADDDQEERDPGEVDYINRDMALALAHPMRIQILAELNKRKMSPSGFSKLFDEKLQTVSYHFRFLQKLDLIEEVEIRSVRGAIEHFYLATKRVLFDGKAWNDLPPSIKAKVSGQTVSDFLAAIALAMLGETFDSSDERMAVWLQKRLDKQGWREAVAAERELVRKMEQIFKGASVRLKEAGEPEGGMLGTYGLFLFESPPMSEPDENENA